MDTSRDDLGRLIPLIEEFEVHFARSRVELLLIVTPTLMIVSIKSQLTLVGIAPFEDFTAFSDATCMVMFFAFRTRNLFDLKTIFLEVLDEFGLILRGLATL